MSISEQTSLLYLLAVVTAVCGTLLLHTAWRFKQRNWFVVLAAWGLICASFYVWGLTTSSDKGVALGVTAWLLITLFLLLYRAMSSPKRKSKKTSATPKKRKDLSAKKVTLSTFARNTLTALLIGPLAGVAAMILSTLLLLVMQSLNVEYTANLAIASILFPVLWASLAVSLGYQQRLRSRLFTVAGVGLGSLAFLVAIT